MRRLLAGKQGRKERGGTLWKLRGKSQEVGIQKTAREETRQELRDTQILPTHGPHRSHPGEQPHNGRRQNPGGHPLKQEAKVPIASHGPDRHHTPPT